MSQHPCFSCKMKGFLSLCSSKAFEMTVVKAQYKLHKVHAKTVSKGLCKAVPLCFKKGSIEEEGSCEKHSLKNLKYYYSLQGPFYGV